MGHNHQSVFISAPTAQPHGLSTMTAAFSFVRRQTETTAKRRAGKKRRLHLATTGGTNQPLVDHTADGQRPKAVGLISMRRELVWWPVSHTPFWRAPFFFLPKGRGIRTNKSKPERRSDGRFTLWKLRPSQQRPCQRKAWSGVCHHHHLSGFERGRGLANSSLVVEVKHEHGPLLQPYLLITLLQRIGNRFEIHNQSWWL